MFNVIFKIVEKKYTYIKNLCFFNAINVHCRRLVAKKKGSDKRRILNGIIEIEKSLFIKAKSGDINQKGIIKINEENKKIKKYFLDKLKNSFLFCSFKRSRG